ncbi:MAG TPA: YgjP-like metallopeptidase domain-containing protein [Kribbella sp.]
MSTASAYLTVRGINIDVIYEDIKNLHIGVYPPMVRVRVAAPERLDVEHVRLAVIQRPSWIKKQREQMRAAQRQSEREMITGSPTTFGESITGSRS